MRFQQIGGIQLTATQPAADDLRETVRLQQRLGVSVEWLEPHQLQARLPALQVEDLTAATYCPEEGYVAPYRLVMALVREARHQGVTVFTETPVTDILVERGRVRGVMTNRGPIAARWVVNAAGPWARRVAWMAGVDIPVAHSKCQILAVRPHSPFPYTIPWVLDRESRSYLRDDAGGVVLLGRLVQEFRADHLLAALVLGQQIPEELRLWSPNRVG